MSDTSLRRGDAVCLRALVVDDMPTCAAWFNDADVVRHLNKGAFPNTHAQQVEHFHKIHASRFDLQLGITVTDGGQLVGTIGLHKIDWLHRHGDISIVLGDPAARGRGYASAAIGLMVAHAFEKMNLHKVTAGMWATNIGSRRAFEKNGFQLEGTLRQSFWAGDRFVDEWRLGLLRSEWEATR